MENTPFKFVLIIGLGDIGRRVAALWRAEGVRVVGVSRRAETVEGVVTRQADLDDPQSLQDLDAGDALV